MRRVYGPFTEWQVIQTRPEGHFVDIGAKQNPAFASR